MKTTLAFLILALPAFALGGQEKKPAAIDLIPKADLGDGKGELGWKSPAKGTLTVAAQFPTHEALTFALDTIPEEYDLVATIERLDKGTKSFHIGIVTPGGTCSYELDSFGATKCSVAMIDGQWGEMVDGPFFRKGKPRTVTLQIRKDGLTVLAEGKKFQKTKVDWTKTSTGQGIKLPDKNHLFLAAAGDSWKVSSFAIVVAGK